MAKRGHLQGFGRQLRIALQTGRLPGNVIIILLLATAAFIWIFASRLGSQGWGSVASKELSLYHKQVDILIETTKAERQKALKDLQPVFKRWQDLHKMKTKHELSLMEDKSELDSLRELHEQRMEGGADESQRRVWEEEYKSSLDRLDQGIRDANQALDEEERLHQRVEKIRLEVEAMGAAIAEFARQGHAAASVAVKGTEQPGNKFNRVLLLEAFGRHSEAREAEARHLDEVERLALADSTGKTVHSKREGTMQSNGQGDSERQVGVEEAKAEQVGGVQGAHKAEEEKKAPVLTKASQVERTGMSRAMLPQKHALPAKNVTAAKGWLSTEWDNKWNGITGPEQEDNSLRCLESGICEGRLSCPLDNKDNPGCITDSAKRQEVVQEAARWSWKAYQDHAFGKDELLPLSKTYGEWFDLGLTLVDSLDTLLLLGLDSEYEVASQWVANELRVDPDKAVNLFETTIRVLGGLLAAFHLSNGDKVMLYKAASLALRLLPAFGSESGIPFSDVNLRTHLAEAPHWTSYSSLSEVTSVSLELSFLARATGEKEPVDKALDVLKKVMGMEGSVEGLAPIWVDTHTGSLKGQIITLGARGDSYYEYMLKQWLLSGKKDNRLLQGYKEAMRGVRNQLLMRTDQDGLLFVGELNNNAKVPKMDHLVCFLPGLLALGFHNGVDTAEKGEPSDLKVAEELMRTCYEMYRRTPTGLAPEIAFFKSREAHRGFPSLSGPAGGEDFAIKPQDAHNLLRPETMESLFVLWRVTRKPHFREWSWQIFRAFHKHSRVESGGYANLNSCLEIPAPMRDKMESFWLAETLKYLYLTLDDSQPQLLSLDEYIFNTEAHPLPIEGSLADAASGHSYEDYKGLTNSTLEARIEYWERLAAEEASKARGADVQ